MASNPSAERYGPLAIERRVKEDGRALLLYSREQTEPTREQTEGTHEPPGQTREHSERV
jgi:hypothetical protein